MTSTAPPPLDARPPDPPDRDFDALREAALEVIRAHADEWTDHNVSGPGITLMEAAVWALADAHYRTANRMANRTLVTWPVEASLYAPPSDRHPSHQPLPQDPAELIEFATTLADHLPTLTEQIEQAASLPDATAAVLDLVATLTTEQVTAAVRLVRQRLVLRAALDGGAEVGAALTTAARIAPAADPVATAAELLDGPFPGLWPPEREAIVRRHIHQQRLRTLRMRADALRTRISAATDLVEAAVAVADETELPGAAADVAVGIHPCPPGASPETWETVGGATEHWPPHPLQARTVEPTTGDDYARLARGVDGVKRAWTVGEVLPGVGWDGQTTATRDQRRGAITILVDPVDESLRDEATPDATKEEFLRGVLRHALSLPWEVSEDAGQRAVDPDLRGEVDDPHRLFRGDLDRGTPRRVICDEVGAALLTTCEITLRGVLHAPVTADRDRVLQRALERVDEFLAAGRHPVEEPEELDCPTAIDGPWPPAPPLAAGWMPGEAIRVAELVQRLADDRDVLGVEALEVRVPGGPWEDQTLELDPQCVPELADPQCLKVTLQLEVAP